MVYVKSSDLAAQHQPRPKLDPEQESFVKDMVLPEYGFQPPAVRVFVGYLGLSPRGLPTTGATSGAASLP